MYVMISCVGRQTMLVSAFRSALKKEANEKSMLLTCDANPYAPGLIMGDLSFCAPSIKSQDYPDWMVEHCRRYKVDLLLTLLVSELLILEGLRERLSDIGCWLVGISQIGIKTCCDKVETARFCSAHGLDHPRIWINEEVLQESELPWPLVAKHRFGQGSRGQQILACRTELETFIRQGQVFGNYVFQEFVGGQEHGIDVINDLQGNHLGILARRKIAMRNGETDIAVTEDPEPFQALGEILGTGLKHHGLLDVDIICQDGKQFVLDLNPRFGGGYPFSHLAGADVPSAYIRWAAGGKAEPEWFKTTPGVVSARASEIRQVYTPMEGRGK